MESDKMKQSPWIAEGRKNQPDMPSKGLVELSTMFNGSTPLPLCSAFPAFLFSFSILPPNRVHQHAPKPIHKPVSHRILILG
jgi:hypothetical protein